MKVAFLTCHLTGSGHLIRTLALARAVDAAGGKALVLSGGRPLAHIDLQGVAVTQLPPVHVDDFDYGTLRQTDGSPADPGWMAARSSAIAGALEQFRPDAFVTETYPFGRRVLSAEFEQAIAHARQTGARLVAASVRDVPEPKPKRLDWTARRVENLFDTVLVHGDPALVTLAESWPLPDPAAQKVRHTGYVTDTPTLPDTPRNDEVLVAVGGGVLGRALLEKAAGAAGYSRRPWRLRVGGPDGAEIARTLTGQHGRAGLVIEPAAADYRERLAAAACSISLCGYNTALDLAGCQTPALLVPWTHGGEREQAIRATMLARHPGFHCVPDTITPEALATLAEQTAQSPRRPRLSLSRDGAARTATLLREALDR